MMEEEKIAKKKYEPFDNVIAFLCLEILALACFGFGGYYGIKILDILGLFIGLLSFGYARHNISFKKYSKSWLLLIPVGVFFILAGFSAFFFYAYGGASLSSFLYLGLAAIGLFGFFFLGVGINSMGNVKKEYIVYAIFGALALYCLVVGIYSLARYGFFYAARFKGLYYYYQGVLFPVFSEGKALIGFEFVETSLSYALLPAFVLSLAGVGAFGLSYKKDKRLFLILCGAAAFGFIYLLLIPSLKMVLLSLGIYLIFAIVRFLVLVYKKGEQEAHWINIFFRVIFYLTLAIGVFLTFAFLTEGRIGIFTKLTTAIFGHVPGALQELIEAVEDCVYNGANNAELHQVGLSSLLFGFHPEGLSPVHFTRVYPINLLWQNGLIAYLCFFYMAFMFARKAKMTIFHGNEKELYFRLLVPAMAIGILLYVCFFSDDVPYAHGDEFLPFTHGHFMMFFVFLFGLTYFAPELKEGAAHE